MFIKLTDYLASYNSAVQSALKIKNILINTLAEKHKSEAENLAICQMQTLNTVLSGGTMSLSTAIQQLGLNKTEYKKLAELEGLTWIAEQIQKQL